MTKGRPTPRRSEALAARLARRRQAERAIAERRSQEDNAIREFFQTCGIYVRPWHLANIRIRAALLAATTKKGDT